MKEDELPIGIQEVAVFIEKFEGEGEGRKLVETLTIEYDNAGNEVFREVIKHGTD